MNTTRFDICPYYNRKKGASKLNVCPYIYEVGITGHCFGHCDLSSDHVCGQCAHWRATFPKLRNRDGNDMYFGDCYYYIGTVRNDYKTNCPSFVFRREGEPDYASWIESRVKELGGDENSLPFSRECRKQARQEWEAAHK